MQKRKKFTELRIDIFLTRLVKIVLSPSVLRRENG